MLLQDKRRRSDDKMGWRFNYYHRVIFYSLEECLLTLLIRFIDQERKASFKFAKSSSEVKFLVFLPLDIPDNYSELSIYLFIPNK